MGVCSDHLQSQETALVPVSDMVCAQLCAALLCSASLYETLCRVVAGELR